MYYIPGDVLINAECSPKLISECGACRHGKFLREIAYLPLAEDIPIAFNSCRKGPRSLGWRDDKPAELYWAEAQVCSCTRPGHCKTLPTLQCSAFCGLMPAHSFCRWFSMRCTIGDHHDIDDPMCAGTQPLYDHKQKPQYCV